MAKIIGVERPKGPGCSTGPAHLDGIGPYDEDGTITGARFSEWVDRIRVEPDGGVIGESKGGAERRIAAVKPGSTKDEVLESALEYWAWRSGLSLVMEGGEIVKPNPRRKKAAPKPRRKKAEEE